MGEATIRDLLNLLTRLKTAGIYYRLSDPTEGAVMVEVVVPGERWEIELHDDGEIGIEIFRSDGKIHDGALLEDLFRGFSN